MFHVEHFVVAKVCGCFKECKGRVTEIFGEMFHVEHFSKKFRRMRAGHPGSMEWLRCSTWNVDTYPAF